MAGDQRNGTGCADRRAHAPLHPRLQRGGIDIQFGEGGLGRRRRVRRHDGRAGREKIAQIGIGNRKRLRGQVRQRSRHQRDLAIHRHARRKLDRSKEQHQHDRHDHGKLDRRNRAAIVDQPQRGAPRAKPHVRHRCHRPALIRLVTKRRRGDQQPLAARQVRDVVAKSGDEQRPLIEDPHDDDVAGASRAVLHIVDEIAAAVDLAVDHHAAERVIALDVGIEVGASEQRRDLAADIRHECRLGAGRALAGHLTDRHAAALRLAGQDHARGILGDGFQHLAGEKHGGGFDDRKQQREKHRGDQGKFNGGRAPAIAAKPAQCISDGNCRRQRHRGIPRAASRPAGVRPQKD